MRLLHINRATRVNRVLTAAAAGLLLLGGALIQAPAAHADDWCWDDPVVQVSNTRAAINVGVQGSTDLIEDTVRVIEITVHVPDVKKARVVSQQHRYFTETVRFVPARNAADAGTVDVSFTMTKGKTPKSAGVQVTSGGKTTTVYGKTHQGITTHFTVH